MSHMGNVDTVVGKLTARDGYHGIALDPAVAERAAYVVTAEIVAWLHEPEALWEIVKAQRDGCPEYAADRLADAVNARFGGDGAALTDSEREHPS